MRALLYDRHGPPQVLRVCEVPVPEVRSGEVLVEVVAIPVGPGDCKLRAGLLREHFEITFPKTAGRYASGIVAALGAGVSTWQIGDEVVLASLHGSAGTASDYVVCSPSQIARKPAMLSHIEAAAMIQGGVTAWACLVEAARLAAGERVIVHGAAGAVGSACVELAVHLGAVVSATCRSTDVKFVRRLGASAVHAFDVPGDTGRISGMDVAIDTIGGDVHARSYAMLRRGGRLVTLKALPIVNRGAEHGVDVIAARIDDRSQVLDAVARLAERGVLRPRVAGVLPLEQAGQAHASVEAGQARRGRLVLQVQRR